jgi:hypothetical protein
MFPLVVAALLAALLTSACAPVQPWERGRLAQPTMSLDEDPMLTSISEHIYNSKEASSGGAGPAGGGCGCN